MTLTKDDVKKIARLARLDLTGDELEKFTGQFESILGYMDQLQELDLKDVEPTSQVTGLTNIVRDDVEDRYVTKEEMLDCANLPVERAQIKVKNVFS